MSWKSGHFVPQMKEITHLSFSSAKKYTKTISKLAKNFISLFPRQHIPKSDGQKRKFVSFCLLLNARCICLPGNNNPLWDCLYPRSAVNKGCSQQRHTKTWIQVAKRWADNRGLHKTFCSALRKGSERTTHFLAWIPNPERCTRTAMTVILSPLSRPTGDGRKAGSERHGFCDQLQFPVPVCKHNSENQPDLCVCPLQESAKLPG